MELPPLPAGPPGARLIPGLLLAAALENDGATVRPGATCPKKVATAVAKGFDLNSGNAIGQTATHIATIHGSIDALEALLSAGAKPDVQNDQGATPLHYAINADKNWRESCVLLLSKGANPLIRDKYGKMPYEFTDGGEMWTMLGGPSLDLHEAAREGRLDLIRKHVAAGLAIDGRDPAGATALHVAVDEEQAAAALLLLELGACAATPDSKGFSPLHLAIIRELPAVAMALLAKADGDNVNFKTYPPPQDEEATVGGPPTETTPLNIAVEMGQADIVQALLDKGADAGIADGNGNNAVHIALQKSESVDILGMLLRADASPDAGSESAASPAHFCAQQGRPEALRALLRAKADVNKKNGNGFTPLHLAARMGHVEVVEVLLAAGADPCAVSAGGATPLHIAVVNKRVAAVVALLRLGGGVVDVHAKNARGETPLQLARSEEMKEILSGAPPSAKLGAVLAC